MSEKRAHVHPAFLPAELYIGIAKAQAKLEIGKSACILLMITECLYREDMICQEVYEKYRNRYRKKLVEIVKHEEAEAIPLTKAEVEKQENLQQMEKVLTEAFKQWNKLKPKAQAYHLKTAKEIAELPIAQLLLKEKGVVNG